MSYEYIPNQYAPVTSVETMGSVPRFGRTSKFSKVFSFSNKEQTDYVMGLIFVAAFVLTFFFVWTVAIFVFMCLGQKEAGFLSGHPFVEPEPKDGGCLSSKRFRRPRRVRLTFLACGVLVILFSVLLVTNGMRNIQDTTKTFSDSNEQVMLLAEGSAEIAIELQTVGVNSVPIRNILVEKLEDFCPRTPNLKDLTGVDLESIATEAAKNLELLKDFVENELNDFREYVGRVQRGAEELSLGLQNFEISEWKIMYFVMPMIILPSFMLVGLFMTWCDVSFDEYQCFLRFFIIPLFGIATVVCWVFCVIFALLAVTNADFCSGGTSPSPEGTFIEILGEQGIRNHSFVYKSIVYYIDGCQTVFPFGFIDAYINDLEEALKTTEEFSGSMSGVGVQYLGILCGSNFTDLAGSLSEIQDNMRILIKNAGRGLSMVSCSSLNSLFTNTFHEGTCKYSVTAFAWVFAALFVVSFCGMLMITLRSAVYDVIWYKETGNIADVGSQKGEFYDEDEERVTHGLAGGRHSHSGDMDVTAPIHSTTSSTSWDSRSDFSLRGKGQRRRRTKDK